MIALAREAGYDRPIYLHGAMEKLTHHYVERGIDLGELRPVRDAKKADLAGTIALCPPTALQDVWTRRFPEPVTTFASGWMRVRARARQRGVELPLVISDHADWDGLTATIPATGAAEVWITHGEEDALVHWCMTRGIPARPLRLVGYGEEEEDAENRPRRRLQGELAIARDEKAALRHPPRSGEGESASTRRRCGVAPGICDVPTSRDCRCAPSLGPSGRDPPGRRDVAAELPRVGEGKMNRFAALLDRLAFEHGRNAKLRQMTEYFRATPDPERGWALAALTGALSFRHAKPGIIRALIAERVDPVLFGLSYDYVGDLSETVALMWPAPGPRARRAPSPASGGGDGEAPTLSDVVAALASLGKAELPAQLARWLDTLDATGRWALLKLITGALRIGVSARLAKTAVAALGAKEANEVELIWPALEPPYLDLFAWIEGRGGKPAASDPAPFRPVMLAHAVEEPDLAGLDPADYLAEWKWDGIRVQAVAGLRDDGRRVARLYSRTGEEISASFPDLCEALEFEGAIDGELLVVRDGRVQTFNILQQRLNRKTVTPKLVAEFPAHLRAYDLLAEGQQDLRERPFVERRQRLQAFAARIGDPRIDVSALVPFATWDGLIAARADPAAAGAGPDADAVEGVMLKRRDAPYLPGRPKGQWWKWKRDPFIVDAVLMYAQRGQRQALVVLFRLYVRRVGPGRGRRRAGAGR